MEQPIDAVQAAKILKDKKSDVLDKFISKSGKPFPAFLVMDKKGRSPSSFRRATMNDFYPRICADVRQLKKIHSRLRDDRRIVFMQLYFKESGQGRAVVLLHGLFGSSDNWHPIALRLAENFHVFALDQRNHGHSPHSAEMNYPLMAADVEKFFAARGLESALVIGHSMGGKTAMQFALQFPHRVEKLVVADMAPRAYAPAHEKIFAALLALDLPQISDAPANRRRAGAGNSHPGPAPVSAEKSRARTRRRIFLEDQSARHGRKLFATCASRWPATRRSRRPALFIRGGKSNYISPEDEPHIRELFPPAQIQTIAEASHWVHANQPDEFLRLRAGFPLSGKHPTGKLSKLGALVL